METFQRRQEVAKFIKIEYEDRTKNRNSWTVGGKQVYLTEAAYNLLQESEKARRENGDGSLNGYVAPFRAVDDARYLRSGDTFVKINDKPQPAKKDESK